MKISLLEIAGVVVAGVFTLLLRSRAARRRRNPHGLPYPPGPKGLPIIGNVFDMPTSPEWVGFQTWGKTYGDLTYVENLGQPLLVINSYDGAVELLDRRSSNYSDRPAMHMMKDPRLMNWYWATSIMQYGERHRKNRQFLHRFFQPSAVQDNSELLTRHARLFILNVLKSPKHYEEYSRATAGAVIMMMAYGHEVEDENDLFINLAERAVKALSAVAVPGAFFVDFLPALKYVPAWFPGAGFRTQAKIWAGDLEAMLRVPYEMTKQKILAGTAVPSMMSQLLESCTNKDGKVVDEDIIASSTAIAYAAGSDTTVSAQLSFLLAIVLFPEVQERGQEEIDRVIGKDRLPDISDQPNLPYIDGIVQEALRWNPVVPIGIPHASMQDDTYNGYFIPGGCQIIANQWAMLHDEKMYPEPFAFKPERWMAAETPRRASKVAFGFGRRICSGRHLAENSIFIGVATILATLNLRKAVDKSGEPITPTGAYKPGFLSYPENFDFDVSPRSADAVALVRQALET